MEIDRVATRRKRLKELIDQRFGGSQVKMIAEIGINAGELSGLLRSKAFGEKKARRLEQQFGLPDGYLDQESDEQNQKSELLVKMEFLLANGEPAQLEAVEAILDSFIAKHDRRIPVKIGAPVLKFPGERRLSTPWERMEWVPDNSRGKPSNKKPDKDGKP